MSEERDILNPEDFIETDEETETDGTVEEEIEVEDETPETETDDDDAKPSEDEESVKQKNAKFAEQRRKKEALEKAEKERLAREQKIKDDAKLEAELSLIKVNPYTDEKIVDEEDLNIYKLQKKIDDDGGDPVNDLPKVLAEQRRKEKAEIKAREQEETQRQEKLVKDVEDFHKDYPNVDLMKLANDKEYMDFSVDKVGRWTTKEIYEAYLLKTANNKKVTDEENNKKIAKEAAKKVTKVPSSTTGGKISEKTILEMSDEDFNKYWKSKYN